MWKRKASFIVGIVNIGLCLPALFVNVALGIVSLFIGVANLYYYYMKQN